MTQRANDLPLPASSGPPGSGPPGSGPFVLAATVSAPFELALSAGVDRRVLLARAGLNEGDLDEPDALVPRDAQTAIWEVVGELPEAETIALDLAERSELGAMGVVGWAMTHAPNGRAVVDSIRRYARLFGDPYIPLIEHEADRTVIHREFEPRIVATRVLPEYAPASTVVLLRRSLGLEADEPLALEVWFQHSPPRDDSRHRALFACPIRFGASETRLVLSGAALERPIEGRDPNLYAYLDRHALSLARGVPQTSTLAARVSKELIAALTAGEPSQADIARRLALSERSLQRHLKSEGQSFAQLLDDARRALARSYLQDPALSVADVAFLLGYVEPSSFHRAFRRWEGEAPREYRKRWPGRVG